MKKLVLILLFGSVAVNSYGQELSRLSLQSMTLDEKSFIQSNGFPLTQYQFDSSEINAQLQAALDQRNLGKKLATYGWIAGGAGLITLSLPVEPSLENPNAGKGQVLLGSALLVGGVTSVFIGSGKKQKAIKRIQNANYQYSALKN